jgi:hypothetical protein
MNVRCSDGDGCQHSQGHSGDAQEGAKWPLERMGPDQGNIEDEWYSHLRAGRAMGRRNHSGYRNDDESHHSGGYRNPAQIGSFVYSDIHLC